MSKASTRVLEIRVGAAGDALDRFEAAWNRAAEGRAPSALHVLSFVDLPLLLRTLSPARFALLSKLRESGPVSIYELARRLGRNYKNVHTDVTQLAALGLIERESDNRVTVAWDLLRAELSL
jgi:predicted transcriptional regulator